MEKHFRHKAFFTGANVRKAIHEGRSEFIPIFLSEVPLLFKQNIIPVDVALLNLSLPDEVLSEIEQVHELHPNPCQ